MTTHHRSTHSAPHGDAGADTETPLRQQLQQTVATPPGPDLDRVRHNALSTWHMHHAQHSPQQAGAVIVLGHAHGWWQRHGTAGWLLVATALCLAIGLRPTPDAALAELQHPDVLSQLLPDDL